MAAAAVAVAVLIEAADGAQYDDRGRGVGTASCGDGGCGGCCFRPVPVDRIAHQRPPLALRRDLSRRPAR